MVSRSICQPTRFGVDEVVAQLRERRESALRARQNGNGRPPLLPSRPVLAEVVNGLAAALFPHRLGRPDLCSENIDHYVGYTLDLALSALHQQVRRELLFRAGGETLSPQDDERAMDVVRHFSQALPRVRELIDSDVTVTRPPAARTRCSSATRASGRCSTTGWRTCSIRRASRLPRG